MKAGAYKLFNKKIGVAIKYNSETDHNDLFDVMNVIVRCDTPQIPTVRKTCPK